MREIAFGSSQLSLKEKDQVLNRYQEIYKDAKKTFKKWPEKIKQEMADDLMEIAINLAKTDITKVHNFILLFPEPYYRSQALRLIGLSLSSEDKTKFLSFLEEAKDALKEIKEKNYFSQAQCDLAVSISKIDTDQGITIAKSIEEPGHRAWAFAMIGIRQEVSDPSKAKDLFEAVQKDIIQIKDHKRRAYVGYVLVRALIGMDRDEMLSELDALRFNSIPW